MKRGVSPSKGVGKDREVVKVLTEMDLKLKSDDDKKDTIMWAKELQRVVYNNEYGKDNKRENWLLNEMMAEKAGIDLTPCKAEGRGRFFKRK